MRLSRVFGDEWGLEATASSLPAIRRSVSSLLTFYEIPRTTGIPLPKFALSHPFFCLQLRFTRLPTCHASGSTSYCRYATRFLDFDVTLRFTHLLSLAGGELAHCPDNITLSGLCYQSIGALEAGELLRFLCIDKVCHDTLFLSFYSGCSPQSKKTKSTGMP